VQHSPFFIPLNSAQLAELKKAALLEVEVKHLTNENERLRSEVEDAKTKLAIVDVTNSSGSRYDGPGSDDDLNYRVELLTRKLAVAELREKNERERSQHSTKMYQVLHSHCEDLESRNRELEKSLVHHLHTDVY
jgi:hypothetical protein